MTYLLDTNVIIALLSDRPPAVRGRFRQTLSSGESVAVSTVALYELWYGVARSQRPRENAERLRIFFSADIGVLPFEEADAQVAGELRAALEAVGTPIGPYDVLIAGQALRTRATLVTANAREFARVPDLEWQDWTLDAEADTPLA